MTVLRSKWNNQKAWARSNKLSLMFMRMTIANNIKTSLPQTKFTSEFLKSVEERFKRADKSLVGTLMAELTTMKYDGQKGIQQHILNMTEKATKLKALGMGMDESFLVHHEEEGKFKKGKNFPPKKSGPGEGSQSHDGKFTVSCYFYGKKGLVKKDCNKSKAWFEKRGINLSFVCYESNLAEVPSNTWWIDSGATTHVTNLMQGFLTTRKPKESEKFLYMGNRLKVEVVVVGEKYFITFIDDLSRYGYVYLMHEKSQAIDIFEMFITEVERQLDKRLKLVPSKAVPKTPFELWTGRKPSLRHIHIWGCPAEARIYNPHEKSLIQRTISGYFIGYLDKSKGYRFYCPNHSVRIVETGNARFLENGEISVSNEPRKVDIEEIRVDIPPPFLPQEIIVPQPVQQVEEMSNIIEMESDFDIGIRKDPVSFSQAMESDDSSKWMEAMNEELKSMVHNGVWDLIELPNSCKPVGCK
ncbi:hypothetical protein CK203_111491 [Vitis vinifera]|uniref:Retroviral polymerase SH3-like domain-containing protein n=1 Tax=Vitis vinifera TaxID=29760 RepID=A0A438CUE7_VITVI|nr:hypothetical protein CK203_111491 [Vitis vinifera]